MLSRARERRLWGQQKRPGLSPLVQEIPADLLVQPQAPAARTRGQKQRPLFPEMAPLRGKKAK
jgi:hypothetical protein